MSEKKEDTQGTPEPNASSAEGLFNFETRPVIEQGVVPHDEEPPVRGIAASDVDDIVAMAAKRIDKKLLEHDVDTAIYSSLTFALYEFKEGQYLGHVDAPTEAYLTGLVKEELYGNRIKKASVAVASNLTSNLDRIAGKLEAAGRPDLAALVDSAANSVEAYYKSQGA